MIPNNFKSHHQLTICFAASKDTLRSDEYLAINIGFNNFLKALLDEISSKGPQWSSKLILPHPDRLPDVFINSIACGEVPVDIIALSGNNISHLDKITKKRVNYPSSNNANELLDKKSYQLSCNLAVGYSDFVLIGCKGGGYSEEDVVVNSLISEAVRIGKPIITIESQDLVSLLLPQSVPDWEISILNGKPVSKSLFARYSQKISINEVAILLLGNIIQSSNFSEDIKTISNSFLMGRFVGKLDSFIVSLFSDFGLKGLANQFRKNLFVEYYGVSSSELPEEHKKNHPIEEPNKFKVNFALYDVRANYFSGCYRDINWILYALSAFAVFAAIAGAISLGGLGNSWVWAVAELLSILGVVFLVLLAKKHKYHERWLTNRFCAELIRYARVGLPFLLVPYSFRSITKYQTSGNNYENSSELCEMNRLFIDSGLPCSPKDKAYDPSNHFNELVFYACHILKDQMLFHKKTCDRNHKTVHKLHKISFYCFIFTLIAIFGHFVVHSELWLIFTAALPAFAASIHGLVSQNEYHRIAQISNVTCSKLESILGVIENHSIWQGLDNTERFFQLQSIMQDAVEIMSNSIQSWQEINQGRATTLPS